MVAGFGCLKKKEAKVVLVLYLGRRNGKMKEFRAEKTERVCLDESVVCSAWNVLTLNTFKNLGLCRNVSYWVLEGAGGMTGK